MSPKLKDFNELMNSRFSCRAFLTKEVDQKTIDQLIKTAQKVPSWCNSQPWKVSLLRRETKELLCEKLLPSAEQTFETPDINFPERYAGIYKTRRATCGWQLYNAVGVQKGDREGAGQQMAKNYEFFGAPHVAIITAPKDLGAYGVLDCGAFITAFTLAAAALGVSSIPQAAIAGRAPIVREVLNIEEDRNVLCAISFGFADTGHPANSFRTQRADLDEFVEWV
ncbi:nitroreductase [Paracoccaceae bacterium]|jgi:nitroreductase|nr:nitroreductase [Paracoccaceae bacterium]